MPILEFAIPCQSSSIDQRTSAVSLFNIVDTLEVNQRPHEQFKSTLQTMPVEFVSCWRKLPDDPANFMYTQVLKYVRSDGHEEELTQIDFEIAHLRYRIHTQLPPLLINKDGRYTIRLELLDAEGNLISNVEPFDYPIIIEVLDLPIVVDLNKDELAQLQKPLRGSGGFQSLLSRIQNQIVEETLVLGVHDAERLVHYATSYGSGGWQQRLNRVVEKINKQLKEDVLE